MSGDGGGAAFAVAGEQVEWTGSRISVARVEVAGPDGSRHHREVVHHPGAVAVVPRHDDGTVTLVRQYRAALDAEMWEIPAGLRDVVLWNITPFADASLSVYSFRAMRQVRALLEETAHV